jgi:hypothetical protein
VLQGASAAAIAAVTGCGDDDTSGTTTPTGTATGSGTSTGNSAPEWSTIPDQAWTVGQPVEFDLADYCSDPDGDDLAFSLDGELPPGLTLEGSVIRGTPTAPFAETPMVATADDGRG